MVRDRENGKDTDRERCRKGDSDRDRDKNWGKMREQLLRQG